MEWLIALITIAAAGAGLRRLMALQRRRPAEPELPEDPYSHVPAGLKKGPPHRSGAVALEEPDEDDR